MSETTDPNDILKNGQQQSLPGEMLLNSWATFIYFFCQWALTVVIARMSGYADVGTFTLANSFSNIFGFIARFGMRSVQVGDVQGERTDGQYFASRLVTAGISLLPFALALALCRYRAELVLACVAMMGYKLLESFDDVVMGTFQRRHRYAVIAISYTLKGFLTLAAFSFSLWQGMGLSVAVAVMSGTYLAVVLFFDVPRLRDTDFFSLSFHNLFPLLRCCLPLMVAAILDTLLIYLPRHAVEKVCGAEELGYYGTISIIVVVLSTLGGAAWGRLLTSYSELIQCQNWEGLRNLLRKTIWITSAFGVLAFLVGMWLGPLFFRLVFGPEILNHMELLPPVLLNAILLLFNSFFVCIFIPFNRRIILLISSAAAVALCACLAFPITGAFGAMGACWSMTAALVLRLGIQMTRIELLFYDKRIE